MSAATAPRARILIADDSDVCRTVLAILLKNTGFDVTSVVNGREALAKLRTQSFDLAILDNDMPELDGLATLAELRHFAPGLPVAVCSGTLSPALRASYEAHHIEAIYDKPVDPRKLREQIPAILERCARARHERVASSGGLSTAPFQVLGEADAALEKPVFAGASAQVRKLVADFGRVRDFRLAATVSGGAGAAFLDVAVAVAEERDAILLACPANRVSADYFTRLFASVASQARPVLLIVLNAERLTLEQQELLHDLIAGGGEFAVLAGRVRLILCAEADLSALADAGEFNELLLMRAGAMKLALVPLLTRRADMGQIARAVLRRIGAGGVRLTPAAMAWIERTEWPGDYMQLHRVVDICHHTNPAAVELDVPALASAFAAEPAWSEALYHDVLLSTLGV